jgi:hypothetical protein
MQQRIAARLARLLLLDHVADGRSRKPAIPRHRRVSSHPGAVLVE